MRHSLAVFLLLTLVACSSSKPEADDIALSKSMPVEKMYREAKELLVEGNYDLAIKQYEKLQSRYPYGPYAQQSLLETAFAYYKQDETEAALSTLERFIKMYPNHVGLDYAYYLRGLANFNGDITVLNKLAGLDPTERDPKAAYDSFLAFRELVTRFPNSKYTPDARVRMQYLVNALAQYEIHVAQYYMRRGGYIAAANRAKDVVSKYPNSPATRDALKILVEAYDKLGMTDLRDAARRVLDANQINQPVPSVGQQKEWWQFWR